MVINRKLSRHHENCVFIDHQKYSQQMVNYLLSEGHRRIAFISGYSGSPTSEQRLIGYRTTLENAGITIDDSLIVEGDFTPEGGYKATLELLTKNGDVTCILAANDDMAIGAMKALSEHHISVPDMMSVAGFDDANIGRYFTPSLTTVRVPMDDIVRHGMKKLLGQEKAFSFVEQEDALVIRSSTAKCHD